MVGLSFGCICAFSIQSVARDSLADAYLTAATVPGQIEMEMIPVESIGVGAEDGRERPAGALVDRAQESPLRHIAVPTGPDRYLSPVGQPEG